MAAKPARVLIGAGALLLVDGVVPTQLVAARFRYPTEFGHGLGDVAHLDLAGQTKGLWGSFASQSIV